MSMAKIVIRVPADDYTPLCRHVAALGTTLSERARTLLLADMAAMLAPPIAADDFENAPQVYGDNVGV